MIKISEEPSTSTKRYNFPVRGCLLFGVPNKGSDVADSASTILKLLATVFNVNRSMVTDLQSKSQKLANIAGEFRQIRDEKSIPVISFYEKQNYNSLLGLVSLWVSFAWAYLSCSTSCVIQELFRSVLLPRIHRICCFACHLFLYRTPT